ncbi:MAG TPA: SBBP repeat-containing protein [Chitinophagaceae bacterium]|nr:SBBP repeat-containing protein [Chitinophagaceae bacterium]
MNTYITKMTAAGDLVWARRLGTNSYNNSLCQGYSIAVDASQNVYTTGTFSGSVDFDPGNGTFNMASTGDYDNDIYISKLDGSGNFLWAKGMGAGKNDFGYSIAVDSKGNPYTTGQFRGTTDFDPGPGTHNLTSIGVTDLFLVKLNPSGELVWAKGIGGGRTAIAVGHSLTLDKLDNVYVTGYFNGHPAMDFDPDAGVHALTFNGAVALNMFLMKLDVSGRFVWARNFSPFQNYVSSAGTRYGGKLVVVDNNFDVHITGYFSVTADFDLDCGTYFLTAVHDRYTSGADYFIAKYAQADKPTASLTGAQTICTGSKASFDIKVAGKGKIAVTFKDQDERLYRVIGTQAASPIRTEVGPLSNGNYTFKFVSVEDENTLSTCAQADSVVKITVKEFLPPVVTAASGTALCEGDNLVLTSSVESGNQWYKDGVALPGGKGKTFLVAQAGNYSVRVTQGDCQSALSNAIKVTMAKKQSPTIAIQASAGNICEGSQVHFTATVQGGTTYKYQWQKNGVLVGTNSPTYNESGLKDKDRISCVVVASGPCTENSPVASNIIELNVMDKVTPAVSLKASATSICPGTSVTFTATATHGGSSPQFSWLKNGQPVGGGKATFVDNGLKDGDVLSCILQSSDACADAQPVQSPKITIRVSNTNGPPVHLGRDTALCGGQFLLRAGPGYKAYRWQDGTTDSVYKVTRSGTYSVEVRDVCNNAFTSAINVVLHTAPTYSLGEDVSICVGDKVTLRAPDGFTRYSWSEDQVGGPPVLSQGLSVAPMKQTRFISNAWTSNGCPVQDSIWVAVREGRSINLGADTSICAGDSLTLGVSPDFSAYTWSTGQQQASLVIKQPGSYWVKTLNQNGCYSHDTLTLVELHKLPAVVLAKENWICAGAVRLLDAGSGFPSYLWNTGSTERTIAVHGPGRYAVWVQDGNGCRSADSTEITEIKPSPANFISTDTAICQFGTLTLSSSQDFQSYRWSTGATTKAIQVNRSGRYQLWVTDSFGCAGSGEIEVNEKQCLEGLFVPNAFTPNGDGKNDQFKPLIFGRLERFHIVLFNRWGQKVFESRDPAKGWSIPSFRVPTRSETFAWVCTYQLVGKEKKIEKGTVTLIR